MSLFSQGKVIPGIVFLGGEGPCPERCRALFREAEALCAKNGGGPLKPEPLTAAADSGLLLAEAAGIRPGWIVGDMDSLDERRLEAYSPGRILRYPADKDYTDAELALSFLEEKGCSVIWLAGGGGGRLDHLLGIRSLFERERPPSRWLTAAEDIYCLDAEVSPAENAPAQAELTLSAYSPDRLVSVFPLGKGPWKAESRGLKWPLDNLRWNLSFFGLSNVMTAESFFIRAAEGRFLVIVPCGAS